MNCKKLINNKKLIKSPKTGKLICRQCYRIEQQKPSKMELESFLMPSYQDPNLKLNLISKEEELFLNNKYSK
jgi:hypothetical protein